MQDNTQIDRVQAVATLDNGDVIVARRIGVGTAAAISVDRLQFADGTSAPGWPVTIDGHEVVDLVADPSTGDAYLALRDLNGGTLSWRVTKVPGAGVGIAWSQEVDFNAADILSAIAIAPDDGHLMVVGSVNDSTGPVGGLGRTNSRARFTKLNSDSGSVIWATTRGSVGSNALDVAVGDDGTVVACGWEGASAKVWTFASNGNQEPAPGFGGVGGAFRAVDIDAEGNIAVAGSSGTTADGTSFVVAKYNSAAALFWVKTLSGDANEDDVAYDVAFDCEGHVLAAGMLTEQADADPDGNGIFDPRMEAFVRRFRGSNGDELWTHTVVGTDYTPFATNAFFALETAGDRVIVAGTVSNVQTPPAPPPPSGSGPTHRDIVFQQYQLGSGNLVSEGSFDGGEENDDLLLSKNLLSARGTRVALGGESEDSSEEADGIAMLFDLGFIDPVLVVESPVDSPLTHNGTPLSFAPTDVGATSSATTVTLRNACDVPLTIAGVALTGSGQSHFLLDASTLTPVLNASQTTTFTVAFNPQSPGAKVASVVVRSDDSDADPFAIPLAGTALAPPVPILVVESPVDTVKSNGSSLSFVETGLGYSTPSLAVVLKNDGGQTLNVASVSVNGSHASDFVLTGLAAAPIAIAPGTNSTFHLAFAPTEEGLREGSLEIVSNDPDDPAFSLSLSGSAIRDHDQDGTPDADDPDDDGDGIPDFEDPQPFDAGFPDRDGDGFSAGLELANGSSDADASSQPAVALFFVDDVVLSEGSGGGTTNFDFVLRYEGSPIPGGFSILVSTADGTATAPDDYQAILDQPVTFSGVPGEEQIVSVSVAADGDSETHESFSLLLGAAGSIETAVGTIENDDLENWRPQGGPGGDGRTFSSTWFASASRGWAVGAAGMLYSTFNGGADWQPEMPITTETLRGVWGVDENNVWVVGNDGLIFKWDGTEWTSQVSGTTQPLNGISGYDANNIWVVGNVGTVLRWDGTAWATQTGTGTVSLLGVWALDANNVWAVGAGGTIRKWDGSGWASVVSGTTSALRSVWATDANTAFAVGSSGVALSWDGSAWQEATSGVNVTFNELRGLSSTNLWIAGSSGTLLRWDGGTNFVTEDPDTLNTLQSLWLENSAQAVAVGSRGTVVRWDGTTWTEQLSGEATPLYGVWGTGPDQIWNVGTKIHRWDGSEWTEQTRASAALLNDMWGADAANIWAVGNDGAIEKWDGSTWTLAATPVTQHLYGVDGSDANNVWAVGNGGTILKWDGAAWGAQNSQTAEQLQAVWAYDATSIWAVGNNGVIVRGDGTNWSVQTSGTSVKLNGVWGVDPNNVWAAGDFGTILKWDGSSWNAVTSGTEHFYALWGFDSNNIWAAGQNGVVSKWDGSSWQLQNRGTGAARRGLWGSDAGNVLSVGTSGLVMTNRPLGPTAGPEILVESPVGTDLASGDALGVGTVPVGAAITRQVQIENDGTADLNLDDVSMAGANPGDFTINTLSMSTTLPPGTTTTFSVEFSPAAIGPRSGTIEIASDDAASPFEIVLNGVGAPGDKYVATFDTTGDVPFTSFGFDPDDKGLEVILSFEPEPGDELKLVDNTGTGPVAGEFDGYRDCSIVLVDINDTTIPMRLKYNGGDGNDVVLTTLQEVLVDSGAGGGDDGASWTNAKTDLQRLLIPSFAGGAPDGSVIVVADEVYQGPFVLNRPGESVTVIGHDRDGSNGRSKPVMTFDSNPGNKASTFSIFTGGTGPADRTEFRNFEVDGQNHENARFGVNIFSPAIAPTANPAMRQQHITIADVDVTQHTYTGLEIHNYANVSDLVIQDSTFNQNVYGMRVRGNIVGPDGQHAQGDGVWIDGCEFNDNSTHGLFARTGEGQSFGDFIRNLFDDVLIENSSFSRNGQCGMFLEKLSNATIRLCEIDGNAPAGGSSYPIYYGGINLYLQYRHSGVIGKGEIGFGVMPYYQDLTFAGLDVTNNGGQVTSTVSRGHGMFIATDVTSRWGELRGVNVNPATGGIHPVLITGAMGTPPTSTPPPPFFPGGGLTTGGAGGLLAALLLLGLIADGEYPTYIDGNQTGVEFYLPGVESGAGADPSHKIVIEKTVISNNDNLNPGDPDGDGVVATGVPAAVKAGGFRIELEDGVLDATNGEVDPDDVIEILGAPPPPAG